MFEHIVDVKFLSVFNLFLGPQTNSMQHATQFQDWSFGGYVGGLVDFRAHTGCVNKQQQQL